MRVPLLPPTESTAVVPEVSSNFHQPTGPGVAALATADPASNNTDNQTNRSLAHNLLSSPDKTLNYCKGFPNARDHVGEPIGRDQRSPAR